MSLAPGARLGPYEIITAIGAGGMGEVFRARDTRLDRDVAIKVLPAEVAQDQERLARFEREAKLLASLNHPNIAHVYGFESAALANESTAHFLAMELVDGEDLAERLKRGAIAVDESIAIAKQIAEGLEEAHERGIVHRDLKPANVKVTPDGKVKILDFGLAKALETSAAGAAPGSAPSQLSHSPTISRHMTEAGMIMGTAAYMSPEQARGKPVDKRADTWAFGVVLFEMLTGERLFTGETVSDVLAAVLTREPDLKALPKAAPKGIARLLRHCLARDPRQRLRDMGDARLALSDLSDGPVDGPVQIPPPTPLRGRALLWSVGFIVGALVVGALDRTLLSRPPADPPRLASLTYSGSDSLPTASSDGRMVAFASTRDGRSRIWIKQLATGEEVALTSGPSDSNPSFAPDGSTLAFVRGATAPFTLYKVAAVGGSARRIADNVASGAAWSPDGKRLVMLRASRLGFVADTVVTLAADGGDEREVARVTDSSLGFPLWRPDGATIGVKTFLTINGQAQQSIAEFDLRTGVRRTLYEQARASVLGAWCWNGSDAILVTETASQSGRGGDGGLRRFVLGETTATTLISLQAPARTMNISGPGRLILDATSPIQNLFSTSIGPRADPRMRTTLTRGESVDRQPVVSPDGTRLAFTSDREGNVDVWELEIESGSLRRLTTDKAEDWDPAYTPDGKQLLWSSNRGGHYEIWSAAADGGGARQITDDGVDAENATMTRDGRWITYASGNPAKNGIWKIHPDGTGATLLVKGAMSNPEISPDGAWVAFVDGSRLRVASVEDGMDIALIELPLTSLSGGLSGGALGLTVGRPRWAPESRTLTWVDFDVETQTTRVMAQDIALGRDTRSTRRLLLPGAFDDMPESFGFSPDGRQIFVSSFRDRSNILMIEGLPGVSR